ncbi:MAG: carboxypeptidase-like regulatory domain-containing protein, partial [Syntrophomonadaceae bacterium]|nr:carboxypeptidase-like regulatory domain-containing protein [Syntrophomonadaceae bacterium]
MKESMTKVALLAIVLLVAGALFVPAVSATYEQTLTDQKNISMDYNIQFRNNVRTLTGGDFCLSFYNIEAYADVTTVYVRIPSWPTGYSNLTLAQQYDSRPQNVQFTESESGKNIGYGTITYNIFYDSNNIPTSIQYWVDFYEWDVTGLSGTKRVRVNLEADSPLRQYSIGYDIAAYDPLSADKPIRLGAYSPADGFTGYYIVNNKYAWSNIIRITDDELSLIRNNDYSILKIESGENVFWEESYDDRHIRIFPPISWTVTNPRGTNFTGTYSGDAPGEEPTPPNQPVMRTGSVTMTDNNGTTISGFEVTAVNAYTGEEYTVATDADVAVMTLPMDRMTEIRNPQTGEYETAPIGYYRFYGQAPGYKMLNEEGIKVSVMPEKYGAYQLCDIGVTSESGYLTGNHKFQIRSRADNSILQTGTISAKSATTGEWYNATLSGGIASLILP